jgi:hypothetical protein
MEFLALLTWLLLAGTGVFLLPFVLSTPGAGLAGLAGLGGLAASFLAILLGAPDCTGWTQVGMATLGIVSAALAGAWLGDEKFTSGTGAEVLQAGVVGLQLRCSAPLRSSRCSSPCTPPLLSSER